MPSLCREVFGERLWRKHDGGRYDAFVRAAAEAKRRGDASGPRVNVGSLLPHNVTEGAKVGGGLEPELKWCGLVQRAVEARGGGRGRAFVPVCDVSGSMEGRPMEVAIALSLLLASSAPRDSPLFGRMFTFHESPTLVEVPGIPDYAAGEVVEDSLARMVEHVRGIEWGGEAPRPRLALILCDASSLFANRPALFLCSAVTHRVTGARGT